MMASCDATDKAADDSLDLAHPAATLEAALLLLLTAATLVGWRHDAQTPLLSSDFGAP